MKWKKVDKYHSVSETGYSVAKNYHRDVCMYSAYTPKRYPNWELLGFFHSAEEAAEACEKHASEKD